MAKCVYCNKHISFFGKNKLCDDCKDKLQELAISLSNEINDLNKQIDLELYSLEYNTRIYLSMIEVAKKIEETKSIIPFLKSTNLEDLKKQIYINIEKYCDKYYQKIKNTYDFQEKLDDFLTELSLCSQLLGENINIYSITSKYYNIKQSLRPMTDFSLKKDKKGTYVFYEGEKVYLLENEEYIKHNNSVKSLNAILDMCIDYIPNTKIKKIVGIPKNESLKNIRNFSLHLFNSFTPSGRPSKYPEVLKFVTKEEEDFTDNIFGDVYYLKNGEIGKARIIIWKDHKVFTVNIISNKGQLMVNRIYGMNDEHKTILLYKLS